jgi:hypothetical protein
MEAAEKSRFALREKVAEGQALVERLRGELQPKTEAAHLEREKAAAAETAKVAALQAANEAERRTAPVSVFISRKTQRLYVRQAFQEIFQTPVTIREPELPIGTHLYVAVENIKDGTDVRWNAVSMRPEKIPSREQRRSRAAPNVAAQAALGRIEISQEALDRISEAISPGSALIISDEGISPETGKGTDFVVLMSGEPQGGIKIRRREPTPSANDRIVRPAKRGPAVGGRSFWWQ